ncbi:hypothetical protein [Chondromyces apiculatus]|uniref:hypothetical protein n=1 Tax=Chondromyces apiculatus TaxID=51 RepID=UPI0005C4A892|nr:hypothetical protein [Chondromyces apiculatus]
MSANFTLPHPDLTRDRLQLLGTWMVETWTTTKRDHRPDDGDGKLTKGVRFFERMIYRLREKAKTVPWLRLLVNSAHLVLSAGAVPLRFYRGKIRVLKSRYRERRDLERDAHQMAFGWRQEEMDTCYRLVLEEINSPASEDATKEVEQDAGAVRVALVRYSLATNKAIEAVDLRTFESIDVTKYGLPIARTLVLPGVATSPENVTRVLPPTTVVKKASVSVKRKPKQGTGSDGSG